MDDRNSLTMPLTSYQELLDDLYNRFNDPAYVHPDPLEFVLATPDSKDREIVALIAACLAYGRVQTILKSVSRILKPMEGQTHDFIVSHTLDDFRNIYRDFVHRFTKGGEIADFLFAVKGVLKNFASLRNCFLNFFSLEDETITPALNRFVEELRKAASPPPISLLSNPEKGSAMKRVHLFLRWMVRKDRVDPGDWKAIPPTKLLYPLDTHIHAFGLNMGLTKRKSPDLKTALEITEKFRRLAPDDPVKYDFSLTRVGILKLDSPL
jgi:uncharacterized protein (TIGR02757 family)